jgi:uncharacterized protein YjbI with pentapeptide repeats
MNYPSGIWAAAASFVAVVLMGVLLLGPPPTKPLAALRGKRGVICAFAITGVGFSVGFRAYVATQTFFAIWPWYLAIWAVVMAICWGWWLWWQLPKREADRLRYTIRDAKARIDIEDNFRKTIGQLLGGAAVLIGAGVAYLQFTQQQRASHDLLISNQIAKGFELLGNKDNKLQQRLGGIYSLEGVMNASTEYYRPVLEALCAFIRDETKAATGDGPPAADVQAALTVIGRRDGSGETELLQLDLTGSHIPKADLNGAKLNKAKLGGADLREAELIFAFLNEADLTQAKLSRANLGGAQMYLASLVGADLRNASLTLADVNHANLSNADLSNADLSDADLSGVFGLTQEQLKQTCGSHVKGLDQLDPPLRTKPCIGQ